MSYVISSDHLEALQDGRVVESGTRLSEAEAKKNPKLIERGVLVKETERRKPSAKESVKSADAESAAAPQEKEESK